MICTTAICTTACIAEKMIKENRETKPFRKISVEGSIDVYYTQNDVYSVVIDANEDCISKIITKVEDETLVIKLERGLKTSAWKILENKIMKVYVSAPALDKVSISGGSDFYADNLECDKSFQLSASGGADAKITSLTVSGNTGISSSGGADCNIKKLQTVECNLSASGGSDLNIDMELSGNLTASASGGADMNLSGKANDIFVSASGGSDINIRKLAYKNANVHSSGGSDVYR